MADLEVDEFVGAVEGDFGAVVEGDAVAEHEVDAFDFLEGAVVELLWVEGEDVLASSGVEPVVAAVDVDGDGGVFLFGVGGG